MKRERIHNAFMDLLRSYQINIKEFTDILGDNSSRRRAARYIKNYKNITIGQLERLAQDQRVNKLPAEILQDLKAIEQKEVQ